MVEGGKGGKGGQGREGVVGRQESGPRIAGGIRKKTKPQPQRRTGAETWLTAHANALGRGGIEEKWWRRGLAGGTQMPSPSLPSSERTEGPARFRLERGRLQTRGVTWDIGSSFSMAD